MQVQVQHDALNQRDSNALVVITADTYSTLGYLPAGVAAALGPLIKENLVTMRASVLDLGRTPSAPVPLMLQVSLCRTMRSLWSACLVCGYLSAPCMIYNGCQTLSVSQ